MADNVIRITYTKSAQGYAPDQAQTIRSLGFTKLYQTVEKVDTPDIRGMVKKVGHLVEVENEQSEDDSGS
jgi:large subunit ribosomal protein L30